MSFDISLPAYVFETNLADYILKLTSAPSDSDITLDFKPIKHFIPSAIVATLSQVENWIANGQTVYFRGHKTNSVCGYMQRIDFFKKVGLDIPEYGERRDASGRFVPIEEISDRSGDAAKISSKMAGCVTAPNDEQSDVFNLIQYACGEIITNVKQHARGKGFVSAQYVQKRDMARIAIADSGRGIAASFRENRSPHYVEGMTDADAIELALKPRVSSTMHIPHAYGSSPNKGVGLSMVRHLMAESLGLMVIISGSSYFWQDGNKPCGFATFPNNTAFKGTICSVAFMRDQIADYNKMLGQARNALGLTTRRMPNNLFE